MAEKSTLPRPVMVLGDALRPISRMIAARLNDAPPHTSKGCADMLEFAGRHLEMIGRDVEKLADDINAELGRVTASDVTDADVWRVAARMEVHVERMLDNYDDVRCVKREARDAMGYSLLADIYRDVLKQVQSWLNEVLDAIDDPVAALAKAGDLVTEGRGDLTIRLTLEAPPQMQMLVRWLEQRTEELASTQQYEDDWHDEEPAVEGRRHDYSLLALVLGAFGLGWLFGSDDDE